MNIKIKKIRGSLKEKGIYPKKMNWALLTSTINPNTYLNIRTLFSLKSYFIQTRYMC